MYLDLQRRTDSASIGVNEFSGYSSLDGDGFDTMIIWEDCPRDKRQEFMLVLCRTLYRFGVPSHRVQHLCVEAANGIGLPKAAFTVSPDILIGCFGGRTEGSRTIMYNPSLSYNISKSASAESLAFRLADGSCSVSEALSRLEEVLAPGDGYNFPLWFTITLWGVSAGASTMSIFGGNVYDGCASFLCGCVARCIAFVASDYSNLDKLLPLIASFTVSLITILLSYVFPEHFCFFPVTLGAIQTMLPGFTLTVASYEILHRQWTSGIARMTMALLTFVLIGVGLELGSQLAFYKPDTSIFEVCPDSGIPILVRLFLVLVSAFTIDVIFGAKGLDLYILVGISFITLALQLHISPIIGICYAAGLASFTGGALSQIQRRFRSPDYSGCNISLGTLMLLVPGGIGARGVTAIARNDFGGAMSFTLQTVQLAMALTFGIFLSSVFKPSGLKSSKVPHHVHDLNFVLSFCWES